MYTIAQTSSLIPCVPSDAVGSEVKSVVFYPRTFLSIQEDVACQKLESIEQWPGSGSGSGLGRVCQRWKGKSQCRGAVYKIDFEHATNLFTRASNSQDSVNHKGN